MTRRLTLRPAAFADLANAQAWYEEQRPGLGREFLASIAGTLTRVEANPDAFPVYYRGFRRVLVSRFPYKVFYRLHGEAVIVFRILHAASDHRGRLHDA